MTTAKELTLGVIFGEQLPDQNYEMRIAVYGIISDPEGRVAVFESPRGFFLPGGGLEPGENHRLGLERELLEELGADVINADYTGVATFYDRVPHLGAYMVLVGHFYRTTIIQKAVDLQAREEHLTLHWLEPSVAISKLKLPHQAWGLKNTQLLLNLGE